MLTYPIAVNTSQTNYRQSFYKQYPKNVKFYSTINDTAENVIRVPVEIKNKLKMDGSNAQQHLPQLEKKSICY